jgi:SPOR domain
MADGHPSSYRNRNDDMADDNNYQNRTSNPSAAPGGQGADPLAELARLIGQNDPYSDFGRDPRAPAPMPQRPMQNEQQLVGQPHADARGQQVPGSYQAGQISQPFGQASQEIGSFRDSAYRESQQTPPGSDFYDEAEPSGRGRGFVTVVAVIVLAVIGTVGAFGYRFIFSGSGSSAPPPVIRANSDPTKVPPPVASGESSQSKLTYERVGDRNQGERVVSREESPVDAKDLNRPNVSRNSPPPSGSANQWAAAVAPSLPTNSPSASAGPSSMSIGEPKKVRTVPIRPEPTDSNMAPAPMIPAGSSPSGANMPGSRSAPASANAPTFAPPPSRAPTASNQMAPQSANAPLALNDDIAAPAMPRTSVTPPPAAQARQLPAQRPAPAPQQLAAPRQAAPAPSQVATAAPRAGGYLVQLSSQRSEAEAQAALRGLQTKYPNVLGGQQATIRRAELGERGVFFRAMVGPFASRDQATQLCGTLKTAGGDCIVQGN